MTDPNLEVRVYATPTGWAWVIYVFGYLRAQGARCASEAQAQAWAEVNRKLIVEDAV